MTTPWTWHGGGLGAASKAFGGDDWLDLSTGINPHGWPGAGDVAIDWRRLPEREAIAELETAAAAHFGVDPAHVCAVPGSEIGLRLVGQILGGPARHVAPGYRTHSEMMPASLPIAHDTLDALDAHDGTLILANPSNPDGHAFEPPVVARLLANRSAGSWLLVDEAFADAQPSHSIAARVAPGVPLAVFRSFGKFFGLAGVRLGFVIAPPPLLDRLLALLGAWPVSAAAIAIGTLAYRDEAWITAMRQRLHADAAALDTMLKRHGLAATGTCPLFRLIETEAAATLFERLARRAILTRPFADQPRWLRIGLTPGPEAFDRLEAALAYG